MTIDLTFRGDHLQNKSFWIRIKIYLWHIFYLSFVLWPCSLLFFWPTWSERENYCPKLQQKSLINIVSHFLSAQFTTFYMLFTDQFWLNIIIIKEKKSFKLRKRKKQIKGLTRIFLGWTYHATQHVHLLFVMMPLRLFWLFILFINIILEPKCLV